MKYLLIKKRNLISIFGKPPINYTSMGMDADQVSQLAIQGMELIDGHDQLPVQAQRKSMVSLFPVADEAKLTARLPSLQGRLNARKVDDDTIRIVDEAEAFTIRDSLEVL